MKDYIYVNLKGKHLILRKTSQFEIGLSDYAHYATATNDADAVNLRDKLNEQSQ